MRMPSGVYAEKYSAHEWLEARIRRIHCRDFRMLGRYSDGDAQSARSGCSCHAQPLESPENPCQTAILEGKGLGRT
jgi:hypothetical protein